MDRQYKFPRGLGVCLPGEAWQGGVHRFRNSSLGLLSLSPSLFHVKNARCFACGGRNVQCRCSASVTAMPYSCERSSSSSSSRIQIEVRLSNTRLAIQLVFPQRRFSAIEAKKQAYPWPLENIFLQILTAHKNYISEELPFKRLNVQFIEYRVLYREVEWNKLEFAGIF